MLTPQKLIPTFPAPVSIPDPALEESGILRQSTCLSNADNVAAPADDDVEEDEEDSEAEEEDLEEEEKEDADEYEDDDVEDEDDDDDDVIIEDDDEEEPEDDVEDEEDEEDTEDGIPGSAKKIIMGQYPASVTTFSSGSRAMNLRTCRAANPNAR